MYVNVQGSWFWDFLRDEGKLKAEIGNLAESFSLARQRFVRLGPYDVGYV